MSHPILPYVEQPRTSTNVFLASSAWAAFRKSNTLSNPSSPEALLRNFRPMFKWFVDKKIVPQQDIDNYILEYAKKWDYNNDWLTIQLKITRAEYCDLIIRNGYTKHYGMDIPYNLRHEAYKIYSEFIIKNFFESEGHHINNLREISRSPELFQKEIKEVKRNCEYYPSWNEIDPEEFLSLLSDSFLKEMFGTSNVRDIEKSDIPDEIQTAMRSAVSDGNTSGWQKDISDYAYQILKDTAFEDGGGNMPVFIDHNNGKWQLWAISKDLKKSLSDAFKDDSSHPFDYLFRNFRIQPKEKWRIEGGTYDDDYANERFLELIKEEYGRT